MAAAAAAASGLAAGVWYGGGGGSGGGFGGQLAGAGAASDADADAAVEGSGCRNADCAGGCIPDGAASLEDASACPTKANEIFHQITLNT